MSHTAKYCSLKISVVILTLLIFPIHPVISQSPPTPTPFITHSLFDDDVCAPPCVFGLIPGQSTIEDVVVFLQDFESPLFRIETWNGSRFDPETGYMTNGLYQIAWLDFESTKAFPREISIGIDNNHITGIGLRLNDNHRTYLKDILDAFGMPDYVLLGIDPIYRSSSYLTLHYPGLGLDADLITGTYCRTDHIGEHFITISVHYRSPGSQITPQRLAIHWRVMPLEIWQSWLDGEVNINCMDAWEQLPQATITPSPTFTVVPTATPTPQ
jgi:hypothetical protein